MPSSSFLGMGAPSSRTFWERESASLSIRAKADRRLASISGPSCRNMMESPLSCRNTQATPGETPLPAKASTAATRNTPNWAATPRHAAQGAQHLGQAHPAALGLLGQ